MNQINRLEETWTPEWDLSLQDSFGFMDAPVTQAKKASSSLVTTEVFNRQVMGSSRIDSGPNSIGALISYFEMQYTKEGDENE